MGVVLIGCWLDEVRVLQNRTDINNSKVNYTPDFFQSNMTEKVVIGYYVVSWRPGRHRVIAARIPHTHTPLSVGL